MNDIAYINNYGLSKILIIDDSELLHRMYDLIFMKSRDNGVEILHAYDGQQGLNMLAGHPDSDLVILDVHMPGMSGLDFLDHCRKEKVYQHIPVLLTGTQGREEDTMKGMKSGAKAYLTKPFQSANLYQVIGNIFAATEQKQRDAVGYSA